MRCLPARPAIALPLLLLAGCPSDPAPPQPAPAPIREPLPCNEFGEAQAVAVVDSAELQEASGIAVSRADPDLLWVHEDSGAEPELWALGRDGRVRGRVAVQGVSAVDWEDLAIARCGGAWCLWIGDIGDNNARRESVALHRVVEPAAEAQQVEAETVAFTYPDGPRDAEGLAVVDGRPVVFSKRPGQRTDAYVVPAGEGPVVAEALGTLELGFPDAPISVGITGADAWDGALALRGYFDLRQWDLRDGWQLDPDASRPIPAAAEEQGEAVAYDPLESGVWTISEREGGRPTLHFTPCGP